MYIKISRFVGIFLFAAAIWGHPALIAAGLPQATQASAQYGDCEASPVGDAIVTASIGDASTLIPILASDSSSAEICGLVYNGLIMYDKDLNLEGELAESLEIKDEGLVIIFQLR